MHQSQDPTPAASSSPEVEQPGITTGQQLKLSASRSTHATKPAVSTPQSASWQSQLAHEPLQVDLESPPHNPKHAGHRSPTPSTNMDHQQQEPAHVHGDDIAGSNDNSRGHPPPFQPLTTRGSLQSSGPPPSTMSDPADTFAREPLPYPGPLRRHASEPAPPPPTILRMSSPNPSSHPDHPLEASGLTLRVQSIGSTFPRLAGDECLPSPDDSPSHSSLSHPPDPPATAPALPIMVSRSQARRTLRNVRQPHSHQSRHFAATSFPYPRPATPTPATSSGTSPSSSPRPHASHSSTTSHKPRLYLRPSSPSVCDGPAASLDAAASLSLSLPMPAATQITPASPSPSAFFNLNLHSPTISTTSTPATSLPDPLFLSVTSANTSSLEVPAAAAHPTSSMGMLTQALSGTVGDALRSSMDGRRRPSQGTGGGGADGSQQGAEGLGDVGVGGWLAAETAEQAVPAKRRLANESVEDPHHSLSHPLSPQTSKKRYTPPATPAKDLSTVAMLSTSLPPFSPTTTAAAAARPPFPLFPHDDLLPTSLPPLSQSPPLSDLPFGHPTATHPTLSQPPPTYPPIPHTDPPLPPSTFPVPLSSPLSLDETSAPLPSGAFLGPSFPDTLQDLTSFSPDLHPYPAWHATPSRPQDLMPPPPTRSSRQPSSRPQLAAQGTRHPQPHHRPGQSAGPHPSPRGAPHPLSPPDTPGPLSPRNPQALPRAGQRGRGQAGMAPALSSPRMQSSSGQWRHQQQQWLGAHGGQFLHEEEMDAGGWVEEEGGGSERRSRGPWDLGRGGGARWLAQEGGMRREGGGGRQHGVGGRSSRERERERGWMDLKQQYAPLGGLAWRHEGEARERDLELLHKDQALAEDLVREWITSLRHQEQQQQQLELTQGSYHSSQLLYSGAQGAAQRSGQRSGRRSGQRLQDRVAAGMPSPRLSAQPPHRAVLSDANPTSVGGMMAPLRGPGPSTAVPEMEYRSSQPGEHHRGMTTAFGSDLGGGFDPNSMPDQERADFMEGMPSLPSSSLGAMIDSLASDLLQQYSSSFGGIDTQHEAARQLPQHVAATAPARGRRPRGASGRGGFHAQAAAEEPPLPPNPEEASAYEAEMISTGMPQQPPVTGAMLPAHSAPMVTATGRAASASTIADSILPSLPALLDEILDTAESHGRSQSKK